jgi:diguanylate cyclase (GGDEF)-like protein
LDRLLASQSRRRRGGALLFLDVDDFKSINDARGHQAGDTLLRTLSEELHVLAGDHAELARLGGDEFAILLPGADEQAAEAMARRISTRLAAITLPGDGGGHGDRLSTSIGIALYPTHGTSTYDLLVNADVAVHQAKDLGRGQYHLFSPDEKARERLRRRARWVARLERALSTDSLVLVYQPIMHIVTGNISHYEVLVRMRLADDKLYPPGAFIPLAEETGLVRPLDHLVMRKAIAKLAEVTEAGRDVRFAVNLSGRTMEDPDLVHTLERLMRQYDVDPQHLIFEVTETAAVADLRLARKLVTDVRSLGCRFALDDFGVGFSSFSYLKQLPADYVKIDGLFIKNLARSHDDQVIVQALAQVISGFGKRTIAEFVQDAETVDLLREYGVDYAQGYYVGKPLLELLDEK